MMRKTCRRLQEWLQYIRLHPILSTSVDVQMFLHASEKDWQTHKTQCPCMEDLAFLDTSKLTERQLIHMHTTLKEQIPKRKAQLEQATTNSTGVATLAVAVAEKYIELDASIANLSKVEEPGAMSNLWALMRIPIREAVSRQYASAEVRSCGHV